jgi:hypothetical protein
LYLQVDVTSFVSKSKSMKIERGSNIPSYSRNGAGPPFVLFPAQDLASQTRHCQPSQRRHSIAADRCNHAKAAWSRTCVAIAIEIPWSKRHLQDVRPYGKHSRTGWNAGAKYRAAAETVHREANPGSDPPDERKRRRLIPVLFAVPKSRVAFLTLPCALQWRRMIDRLRRSSQR